MAPPRGRAQWRADPNRGAASPTPSGEPRCMAGPVRSAYGVIRDHPHSGQPRRCPLPPRSVVAACLAPGPLRVRGHPGPAGRADRPGCPAGLALRPPFCHRAGRIRRPDLGGVEVAVPARVARGPGNADLGSAGADRDPPPPAAGHGRSGDTAAACSVEEPERARHGRRSPVPGHRAASAPRALFSTWTSHPPLPTLASTSYRWPGPPCRTTFEHASVTASRRSATPSSSAPRSRSVSPSTWRMTGTLSASRGNTRQNLTSTVGSSAHLIRVRIRSSGRCLRRFTLAT